MSNVKFYREEHQVPLEMHKVRIVQKLYLLPVEERQKKMEDAGNNTFLLHNKDIYIDMLTDSCALCWPSFSYFLNRNVYVH